MDQRNPSGLNAEDFVRDLGEGSLETLAMRVNAYTQFETAIGGQAGRSLLVTRHHRDAPALIDRSAMRALLAKYCKPDADAAFVAAKSLTRAYGVEPDRSDGTA